MDRIKMKFIIAVTNRLSAAADSNAKTDLIEELSDNLYQRYEDLTASGMGEDEAYEKALEDLGDVDELLEYLRSLGPDGELPKQEGRSYEEQFKDFADDLGRNVEEIVRETISQTKDAVDQAKVIVRDVMEKLKEKYPNGFSAELHFDTGDDDHGEHPKGEDHENDSQTGPAHKDVIYSFGYDKKKGGFFTQCGEYKGEYVEGTAFPSQDLKGVNVQLNNGDVNIHLVDDPAADVELDGDTDKLEVRISDSGVLSIRQGNTASSSFFFGRGLASADVELYLPRRFWEFIQISAINGDVTVDEGLEAGRLAVKTTSGDLDVSGAACTELAFKSASGDLEGRGLTGGVQAETMSGDIQLEGSLDNVRASSMSGDVDIRGSVQNLRGSAASGDVSVDMEVLPLELSLSSKSGDCRAKLPVGQGFTLHFETISGDLNTDFPLVGPMGGKSGDAIYLDGGERTFTVSSISGDLTIRQR